MTVFVTSPGGGSKSTADIIRRGIDMRVLIGGLNDGDTLSATLPGYSRLADVPATIQAAMLSNTAGGTLASSRMLDGRRSIQWFSNVGQNTVYCFRPANSIFWYLDFGAPAFQPLVAQLAGALPTPQFGWATEVMAFCRKLNAIDGSSCRMGFGFANNTVVSPSAPIPRCGLLGDGAGGYRYGSVNCPDGAIGGSNADGDIDANSVQPQNIVNPGVNWWHTRLKMIPARPSIPAMWAAYHNGGKAIPFTTEFNFPRGHQTTNDHYGRIEATYWNFSGDIAGLHVPELCMWDVWVIFSDDYSL